MADPTLVGDTIGQWLDTITSTHRWPRLRHGPRPLADPDHRHAIWWAVCDSEELCTGRIACRYCGTTRRPLHLDHLIPWSAYGCDHPHNLRLACPPCNDTRSNFATYPLQYRTFNDMTDSIDCAGGAHPAALAALEANAHLFGVLIHDEDYWDYPELEEP